MQAENGAKNCKCVTLLEKSEVKDAGWSICSDQAEGGGRLISIHKIPV